MSKTVYIDGQAGTTGLDISSRLRLRDDINLFEIDPEKRKDQATRADLMNAADLVILCLPDAAAQEAVTLISNPDTKIIDASSAHRTDPDWVYGLPELTAQQRTHIRSSTRVSNPGCYPQGFILAILPLIKAGLISASQALTTHAQSGYSGGGRQLIESYQAFSVAERASHVATPYALELNHKHCKEMNHYSTTLPAVLFCPTVCDYYQGMLVHVPLSGFALSKTQVHDLLSNTYEDEPFICVQPLADQSGIFLDPTACNLSNRMDMFVFGNEHHIMITSRYDNLGKGAGGAAIQNLNLMLGIEEDLGLSS